MRTYTCIYIVVRSITRFCHVLVAGGVPIGYPGMLGEDIPGRVEGEGGAGAGFLVLQRGNGGVLGREHAPDGHHRP